MSIAILTSNETGANSLTDINANFATLNTEATATTKGLVPTPPNDTTKVLRGDATWASGTTSVVSSSTTTLSLTTLAGQRVVVMAKGTSQPGSAASFSDTILLKYNGVTKDTVTIAGDTDATVPYYGFSLMYTEVPGAGTHDITVTCGSSVSDVVIIAQIIG